MPRRVSAVLVFVIFSVSSRTNVRAQPGFALRFHGLPQRIEGPSWSRTDLEVFATMTPIGDLRNPEGELNGAQGWSISMAGEGSAAITGISLEGTDAISSSSANQAARCAIRKIQQA